MIQISVLALKSIYPFGNKLHWLCKGAIHGTTTYYRKTEDDHYFNALNKYAREMAIQFKEHTSFLSTNDKKKCNGERNCPSAVVTRGRKVLVAYGQVVQT